MATRIIEYADKPTRDDYAAVPANKKITAQTALTATGTSAQSAAVTANTRLVCVQSDEAVYVALGTNPTATTDDYRLQAGQEQFFIVPGNASWKVAVRT